MDKFRNKESSFTCCIEDKGVCERDESSLSSQQISVRLSSRRCLAVLWTKFMVLNGQGKNSLNESGMNDGDEQK